MNIIIFIVLFFTSFYYSFASKDQRGVFVRNGAVQNPRQHMITQMNASDCCKLTSELQELTTNQKNQKDLKNQQKDIENDLFSKQQMFEIAKMKEKENKDYRLQIQSELIEQKNTLKIIACIQQYFDGKGRKPELKEKELLKLINALIKDNKGMDGTKIDLSKGKGSHTKLHIDGTLYVFSKHLLRNHIKPLIDHIRQIIESKYEKSFDEIYEQNDNLLSELKGFEIDSKIHDDIMRHFGVLKSKYDMLQTEISENAKSIKESQQDIYQILNGLNEENPVLSQYELLLNQQNSIKEYYFMKATIFRMKQRCRDLMKHQNENRFQCLSNLTELTSKYRLKKKEIQPIICGEYIDKLVFEFHELSGKMKCSPEYFVFTENTETLQETVKYINETVSLNKEYNVHLKSLNVTFLLHKLLNGNYRNLMYCNQRGFCLWHSLNQARRFLENVHKINSFWKQNEMIIKQYIEKSQMIRTLKCDKSDDLDIDLMYLWLKITEGELHQLLCWIDIFDIPWNKPHLNGSNIFMNFVEMSRITITDTRHHNDITNSLKLWKEATMQKPIKTVIMTKKAKRDRILASLWYQLLINLNFSFY